MSASLGVGMAPFDPNIFTVITPVVTADASGGVVEADANTNFSTNIPLGYAMVVTEVAWNLTFAPFELLGVGSGPKITHWNWIGQITESLNRAKIAADPLNIDYFYDERYHNVLEQTAVGIAAVSERPTVYERHPLRHPWATVAQKLNLVVSVFPQSDNAVGMNGPKTAMWAKIFFQLFPLNTTLQSYLATRIQISSQA